MALGLAALASAYAAAPASAGTAHFHYTGGEQTFTVPAWVYSLHVVATGAGGGNGAFGVHGGPGEVMVADVAVTPGEKLYIEVGGGGNDALGCCSSSFNGGGPGGADFFGGPGGGGGGGATDIRRLPRAAPGSESSRLVVAGGGGGGAAGIGGAGGFAGGICEGCAAPGGAGATSAGGAGGDAGGDEAVEGSPGALGTGGEGGEGYDASGGGGGGGGYYGGGGGGGGEWPATDGGGGGGGSSFAVGGGSRLANVLQAASVGISYDRIDPGPSPVYATPNPLRFSQAIGTVGERTVTLTNVGTIPLAITRMTLSGLGAGDFGIGPGCTSPVPAGGSCQLTVRFAPRTRGYREARLTIANSVHYLVRTVFLMGHGAARKPVLSALRISPSTFKAARRGKSLAAGGKAAVSYRADVAGKATFRVLRVKGAKRTRLVPVGASFTHAARAGTNRIRFTGRVKDHGRFRKLPPGRYRLRGYGSGPSRSVSAAFRIVR